MSDEVITLSAKINWFVFRDMSDDGLRVLFGNRVVERKYRFSSSSDSDSEEEEYESANSQYDSEEPTSSLSSESRASNLVIPEPPLEAHSIGTTDETYCEINETLKVENVSRNYSDVTNIAPGKFDDLPLISNPGTSLHANSPTCHFRIMMNYWKQLAQYSDYVHFANQDFSASSVLENPKDNEEGVSNEKSDSSNNSSIEESVEEDDPNASSFHLSPLSVTIDDNSLKSPDLKEQQKKENDCPVDSGTLYDSNASLLAIISTEVNASLGNMAVHTGPDYKSSEQGTPKDESLENVSDSSSSEWFDDYSSDSDQEGSSSQSSNSSRSSLKSYLDFKGNRLTHQPCSCFHKYQTLGAPLFAQKCNLSPLSVTEIGNTENKSCSTTAQSDFSGTGETKKVSKIKKD